MSTRIIDQIGRGEVTDLRTYVLSCARESYSVEPGDLDITFEAAAIEQAQATLERLQRMTREEMQLEATRRHERVLARVIADNQDRLLERSRYEAMLEKVKAWKVSFGDLFFLQVTMIRQLESCFLDCVELELPERETAEEWLELEKTLALQRLERNTRSRDTKLKIAAAQAQRMQELLAALGESPAGGDHVAL